MNRANETADAKLATESAPAGMNSITNTVGMHPTPHADSTTTIPSNIRRGSCDNPHCTSEHSGKMHE